MTPWERERMQEYVDAKIKLETAQMAEREAARRIKDIRLTDPLVVTLKNVVYVVDLDDNDLIQVREAKS